MRKCTSMALPMILQGKGKNAECETWRHLGVPKFSTNVAKRTERTQIGQFPRHFLLRFCRKIDDFGGPGRPCTRLGGDPSETSHHFFIRKNRLCIGGIFYGRPPPQQAPPIILKLIDNGFPFFVQVITSSA